MIHSLRSILAKFTVVALITSTTPLANAGRARPQSGSFQIGPSKGEVVAIGVGIAAAGAAIGIGTYYVIRRNHNLTGCAWSGPAGLQLENESDHATYALIGDVASIEPGDRVRVSGKKRKAPGGAPRFFVEKLSKDFGVCKTQPAMR